MDVVIEKLKKRDCMAIAKVVTETWNTTYEGIVNKDYLENLKKNEKERGKKLLASYNEEKNKFLVLKQDNKVIGFIRYDKAEDINYPQAAEITAIYVLKEYQRQGLGRKLFKKAKKQIKRLGYKEMIVGCLAKNPNNGFYKYFAGKVDSKRMFTKTGDSLEENVYLYQFN